jgi:hypothetical protein
VTSPGVLYHFYGGVSKRCGRPGVGMAQTSADAALRDRFAPGKPLWLTETGETACGGNPWASTFTDTLRKGME